MMLISALFFAALAAAWPSVAQKEHVAKFWQAHALNASMTHMNEPLRIALKHPRDKLAKLEALHDRVSDPRHAQYGKYLGKQEIGEFLMGGSDAERVVAAWLLDSGIATSAAAIDSVIQRDWLVVKNAPYAAVAAALGVRFHSFQHRGSRRTIVRSLDQPSLPDHVAAAVDVVLGVSDFFDHPNERRAARRALAAAPFNNGPEISVRGSHERLVVTLKPYDVRGQRLAQFDSSLVASVAVTTDLGEQKTAQLAYDASSCFLAPDVVCVTRLQLPAYSRVRVAAQTLFGNGVVSNKTSLGFEAQMAGWVDPQTAFDLYGIPQGTFAVSGQVSQAVVAFEEQWINFDDLKQFHDLNGLFFNQSLYTIVGPNNASVAAAGGESTLDITWISAIGRNVPTFFLSFCNTSIPTAKGPCGAYILDWAIWVANASNPSPLVTSISYGDTELEGYFAKFGSWSYIDRMEAELLKMAVNGLTVIAGSGDAGATNVGESGNDISNTDPDCSAVRPFYPSDSKYVVSASATLLSTRTSGFCASAAADNNIQCSRVAEASVSISWGGTPWTTGGAFSGHIRRPFWQDDAIKTYFASLPASAFPASFNTHGRGYADLSAIGFNLMLVLGGEVVPIGGTSASGPVLGGFFSLLNDIQFQRGRPPLGNPLPWIWLLLSQTSGAFNDLAFGRNDDGDMQARGSPFPSQCPVGSGFPLTARWDAPSGWGSPQYPAFVANLP